VNRGWASFGLRAELERQGIPPEPEPAAVEDPPPAAVEEPKPRTRVGWVEISVLPVLYQEALIAVTDQIAAAIKSAVKSAFQEGVAEAVAEAEAMMDDD
jgi:hypothetical protein